MYLHGVKSGRFRYVDSAMARTFGLGAVSCQMAQVLERIHSDDLARHAAHLEALQALGDHEFTTLNIRLRDQGGDWRMVGVCSWVLRRAGHGQIRVMAGSVIDMTEMVTAAVHAAGVSLLNAEQNERSRIGRELHDSTAQHLVAADLGLASFLRSSGALSVANRECMKGVQASLSTAQAEMRAFAYVLHAPELHEVGLLSALGKFCTGFAGRSGLEISFTSKDVPRDIPSDAEHALFRVCQEALMNVYRHAYARRVAVSLRFEGGGLALEVRDDGVGVQGLDRFEQGGMGVAGMRARINSVGGQLRLDALGPGLAVIARIPQAQPREL